EFPSVKAPPRGGLCFGCIRVLSQARASAMAPSLYVLGQSRQQRRDRRETLGAALEQRPEIGARALRLAPRGFRGVAEAEISVDQAGAMMVLCGDACGGERI